MTRFPCIFLFAMLCAAVPGHAAGLPDTGQVICYNNNAADGVLAANPDSISRDGGTHPRQDCRYGPDAAAAAGMLTKTGAGVNGFDYTKIANNGVTLVAGTALGTANTAWACTKDNITGLTWEIKTATSTDLRYSGHRYSWYDSNGSNNGGLAGQTGTNTCNATLPSGLCNTQAFVAAVNAAALCTYTDWRLPTRRELETLVNANSSNPSIDPTYFPNTPASSTFWSGSPYMPNPAAAWTVFFFTGSTGVFNKVLEASVRLVRGGQF